jgi:uncharacterized protein
MDPSLLLILIGLAIGLVLGLTGAGGSLFAVPLLILLLGLPMGDAAGIALGAVAASSLFGSLINSTGNRILWLPGAIVGLSGALCTPLGSLLGTWMPEPWRVAGFSLLAVLIAGNLWRRAQRAPESAQFVRASRLPQAAPTGLLCRLSPSGQFELRPRCLSGLILGGILVGVLSGLFGVGGGFLIVPLLLALSPISMAQAVATSLAIITAISSLGFANYLLANPSQVDASLGLVLLGGLLGMLLGLSLSPHIANARLQKFFALALVMAALFLLFRLLKPWVL